MHIAFFNPQGNFDNADSYWTEHPDFGGQLVYVKELAKAIQRRGHEAVIFTRRIQDPAWPEFQEPEEVYQGSGVKIIRLDFGGPAFLHKEKLWPVIKEYAAAVEAWYAQRGNQPDVVTTHYGDGGIAGALFEESTGIPFTFTAHSLGAQKMDKMLKHADQLEDLDKRYCFTIRLAAERTAMGRALVRMVSTAQEKEHQYQHQLYQDLFVDESKRPFAVIPPGVNQDLFSPRRSDVDKEVNSRFQQMMDRDIEPSRHELPVTIASSRLDAKKNVTGLVEAFARNPAWQAASNLMLAVRGVEDPARDSGSLKPEEQEQLSRILTMVKKYHLSGKITFVNLSSQQALGAAYRETARRKGIFCLTSLYEPFGLATIEAMSCGLPVVVTANGGGQEILNSQGERHGILVNPEDSQDIAQGALTLLKDGNVWENFREQGLRRVQSTYTWDAAAQAYVTSIEEHLSDTRKRGGQGPEIPAYFNQPTAENMQHLSWMTDRILERLSHSVSHS